MGEGGRMRLCIYGGIEACIPYFCIYGYSLMPWSVDGSNGDDGDDDDDSEREHCFTRSICPYPKATVAVTF